MSSELALSVEGLTKEYRLGEGPRLHDTLIGALGARLRGGRRLRETIRALDGVSFDVEPGQVLGIVGRNGAGKTTLLKVLSRVTKPTAGAARVWGRVGALLEVGTGFHPDLTGRENVFLNGAILGMKRREIEAKYDEIVSFAELERFVDTPVKRYSTGMYLRLAFAVAAHLEPEILVVDEVLAVGDASFQRRCLQRMGEVSSEGRTVLLVSHNMAAITSLASRCIWLDAGRIRQLGAPDEVVAAYLSSDAAGAVPGYAELGDPGLRAGVAKRTQGDLHFDWVRLVDRDGETTNVFFEDEPLRIELGLEARLPADAVEVLVKVQSVDGALLFTLLSGVQELEIRPGKLETAVVVPRLPLRPGRYHLDLYALTRLPQDYLVAPVSFEVAGLRGVPSGTSYERGAAALGPVKVEQEWEAVRPPVASRV